MHPKLYIKNLYCLFFFVNFGCITTDFNSPKVTCKEVHINPTTTLKHIKSLVRFGGYNFRNDEIITAYVISTDKSGNEYKRLVLQDALENPSAGIGLLIDKKSLYTKYPIGQKIYLKLKGLTLNYYMKNIVLGKNYNGKTESIASSELQEHLFRSCDKFDIIPQKVTFENIDKVPLQTLIQIQHIQFSKTSLNKTYAHYKNSKRTMDILDEKCNFKITLTMENSPYADFSNVFIPSGKGTITGILSKDDEGNKILKIRSLEDVNLTQDRCL